MALGQVPAATVMPPTSLTPSTREECVCRSVFVFLLLLLGSLEETLPWAGRSRRLIHSPKCRAEHKVKGNTPKEL